MNHFILEPFDPCPTGAVGALEGQSTTAALLALDIRAKYLFVDDAGATYHEYPLPANADIHNCGGYVDKLVKYRDPDLCRHLEEHGVNDAALLSPKFPLLQTRSPRLDLVLFRMIERLRAAGRSRVSLFELGCTVGEHWDLLDTMLRADSQGAAGAADVLSYCGLDKAGLLLAASRVLHAHVPLEHFQLIHAEGSDPRWPDRAFDLVLSVGVVNHVADPKPALARLLRSAREGAVLAIWMTGQPDGLPAIIHSGLPFYFFSGADLAAAARGLGGKFYLLDYIPEDLNTQSRSYVGLGGDALKHLGCYHVLYSRTLELEYPVLSLAEEPNVR